MIGNPARNFAGWTVDRWVKQSFPEVPALTTQCLADWLSQGKEPLPILLDVRQDSEFAVSHLPEAQPAPSLDTALALELDRHQPIVAYCSVGYRSARLVRQLRQRGYTQIYNLEGSIFRWANEGRSLQQDDQPVAVVHPFSALWSPLLRPGLACWPSEP